MSKKAAKKDIEHMANLSKLSFDDKQLGKFEEEFNNILDYISMIEECDTSDIQSEHHINKFQGDILQEDKISKSLERKKALKNATQSRATKEGYIRASRAIKSTKN